MAPALIILLLGAAVPRLAAQSDNFNDGDDTSPVAWNHYTLPLAASTFTFPLDPTNGHAYAIYAAPATNILSPQTLNARAASFPLTPTYTNRFSVGTDLLAWSTNGFPQAGLFWYFHGPIGTGTSKGYTTTYSVTNRNIYINIVTNENTAGYICRLQDGDITLDPTNHIRMVASSHDGSTFVMTVYNLLEPNTPWASIVGVDYTWWNTGGNSGYLVLQGDYPSTNGVSATFDNYAATEPAANTMPAMVTDVYPPPAGTSKAGSVLVTNSVMILNRDTPVDLNSILLCLDGTWIPNANLTLDSQVYKQHNPSAYQQVFGGATATYVITNVLAPGSKHTNVVAFSDYSTWYTNRWTWTVGNYPFLYASNSLPLGSLSVRGFDVRMAQTTNGGTALANSLDRARQQLAGTIAVDQRATSIVQVLNWNKTSADPDNVPGLCPGGAINIAAESCAYLQLTAGAHRFHIVTDDRSGAYSGVNLSDATTSAIWEAPNATANTTFDFVVQADGLYPFCCLWEETTGSANLALYSVDLNDATEVLINDATDPTGVVKAWYPVVCTSSASATGLYTLATTAVSVLNTADILGSACGSAVVGQKVASGTFTVPISGTMRFYRLDGSRKTKITNISTSGSNVVITYQ